MSDKIWADGFVFERKDNAPQFIIGRLSCSVNKAIEFLEKHRNEKGWVNISIKQSKGGAYYMELDTWKPEKKEDGTWTPKPQTQEQIDEMANKATIEYPEEDLEEPPF